MGINPGFRNRRYKFFNYPKSILLDGIGELINFSRPPEFAITDNLSIFAWMKTDSTDTTQTIIGKYTTTLSALTSAYLISFTTLMLRVTVSFDGKSILDMTGIRKIYQSTATFNDGNWHFMGFTFVNDVFKIYVDGVHLVGPALNIVEDDAMISIFPGTQTFQIGAVSRTIFFIGNITGCTMWDTQVLSDAEIVCLYNNGTPVIDPLKLQTSARLVWGADFNQDGDDSTHLIGNINDITANNNNGQPVNTEIEDIVDDGPP